MNAKMGFLRFKGPSPRSQWFEILLEAWNKVMWLLQAYEIFTSCFKTENMLANTVIVI